MARTTNYSKKIEKIKSQLDELGAVINSIQNNSNDAENPSPAINIKALDIGKYIVIYLIVAKIIQKGCKEVLKKNLNKAEIKIKQVSDCAYAAFTAF